MRSGRERKEKGTVTNEEAIKILKSKMDGSVDTSYEWAEAVRMAIEALRNEINCVKCVHYTERETDTGIQGECKMDTAHREDLISRQTIIDAIEETDWYHINRNGEMVHGSSSEYESWYKYDDIFKAIKSIPSAEPNLQPTCNRFAITEGDLISREAVLSLFPNGFYSGLASQIKSLPSATCDDCIWHVCNYNKIDWDGEDGYISRRDAIKNAHFPVIDDAGYEVVRVDDILALPTAEPKTGEWVEVEDYNGDIHYQCDQCGDEFILIDGTPKDNNYHFCPNCGARMNGGEKE